MAISAPSSLSTILKLGVISLPTIGDGDRQFVISLNYLKSSSFGLPIVGNGD
jgi:hypothetical protein